MALRKDKKWKGKFEDSSSLSNLHEDEGLAEVREQKLEALEEALSGLNEEQRICLDLFYLKDKSYADVANLTGFEIKQVKSHIQNGKRNLKNQLSNNNEVRS